jgi:aspartate kinase
VSGALRVIKFGGDALATPERIAEAARWAAAERARGPLVLVASARRGVTDHLYGLVAAVEAALPFGGPSASQTAAGERAIAAGEEVSASLLALALERLGVPAVALDAREAGLSAEGAPGAGRLGRIHPKRLQRLLAAGVTPVVTGFQGWQAGRVALIGRGGSDTTAVALAAALGAARCELVKEVGGLFTADPALVGDALLLPAVTHRFLAAVAAAGAKVVSEEAARLAFSRGVPLRLLGLRSPAASCVTPDAATPLQAVAHRFATAERGAREAVVTVVRHGGADPVTALRRLYDTVRLAGLPVFGVTHDDEHAAFRVPAADAATAVRALHAELHAL